MIVFAAITPHSPILLPSIGREKRKGLEKTINAFEILKKHILDSRPDTILIISPHNTAFSEAITLNLPSSYSGELSAFGDLQTHVEFRANAVLIDRLQRFLRKKEQPVTLMSVDNLDYGATVPLALMAPSGVSLISVFPSPALDSRAHFVCGQSMQEVLSESQERIAIIASNNLSHRLTSDAPAGFSESGQEFDKLVQEALKSKNIGLLLGMKPKLMEEAEQCGFRGTMLLLGAISELNAVAHILSYEHPFGIGYLTAEFSFS